MATAALLDSYKAQIFKALAHLSYSYKKVQTLSAEIARLDTEQLETWEGFVARFARASDIFLSKYLRAYVLQGDPAFRGSLRDFVNQAEKLGLVENADIWLEIRGLRNLAAHEYSDEKLSDDFAKMREFAPVILALEKKL